MLAYILTQIGGRFEEENQLIRFVVSLSIDSEFSFDFLVVILELSLV